MGNTELILDVQLRILSFADKRTICQLMQTCRTLNHYGAKALLAWGPVCLDTESKQAVLSFLQFLGRDPLYRLSHFHWLELTRSQDSQWPTVQAEEVGPLLESLFLLLARHGSLQVLTIDDIEVVLDLKTDLSSAISMVGTLKDIHLALIASRGANMLMMSRSTLGDADLSMDGIYEDDEDSEDEEDSEPFRLDDRKLSHILHGSQHSLHSLTVSGYGLRGAHIGPRYPRMANLAHLFPDTLRTRNYVHAFPNLRTLKVMHWIDSDDWSTTDDLDELRSENEREQAQYGAWSSLWKFDGSIPTLFLLAPPCHIHALEITDDYDLREVPSKALDMLLSCIDVAHPRHISLTSYNGRWMSDTAFLSAWTRPALQSLVHLQLVFSLRPNYGDDQEPGPEVDLARGLVRGTRSPMHASLTSCCRTTSWPMSCRRCTRCARSACLWMPRLRGAGTRPRLLRAHSVRSNGHWKSGIWMRLRAVCAWRARPGPSSLSRSASVDIGRGLSRPCSSGLYTSSENA